MKTPKDDIDTGYSGHHGSIKYFYALSITQPHKKKKIIYQRLDHSRYMFFGRAESKSGVGLTRLAQVQGHLKVKSRQNG